MYYVCICMYLLVLGALTDHRFRCMLYCLYCMYWYVFVCIRHVFVCIELVYTSSLQTNTNIQTNTNTIQTRKICMYCVRRVYVLCMYSSLCVLILKTWIISWNRLFRGICTSQWILTVSAVKKHAYRQVSAVRMQWIVSSHDSHQQSNDQLPGSKQASL